MSLCCHTVSWKQGCNICTCPNSVDDSKRPHRHFVWVLSPRGPQVDITCCHFDMISCVVGLMILGTNLIRISHHTGLWNWSVCSQVQPACKKYFLKANFQAWDIPQFMFALLSFASILSAAVHCFTYNSNVWDCATKRSGSSTISTLAPFAQLVPHSVSRVYISYTALLWLSLKGAALLHLAAPSFQISNKLMVYTCYVLWIVSKIWWNSSALRTSLKQGQAGTVQYMRSNKWYDILSNTGWRHACLLSRCWNLLPSMQTVLTLTHREKRLSAGTMLRWLCHCQRSQRWLKRVEGCSYVGRFAGVVVAGGGGGGADAGALHHMVEGHRTLEECCRVGHVHLRCCPRLSAQRWWQTGLQQRQLLWLWQQQRLQQHMVWRI